MIPNGRKRLHAGRDRLVMIEKYESSQARSEHPQGAALASLRTALAPCRVG